MKKIFIYENLQDKTGDTYDDIQGFRDISNPHFQATTLLAHDVFDHFNNEECTIENELLALGSITHRWEYQNYELHYDLSTTLDDYLIYNYPFKKKKSDYISQFIAEKIEKGLSLTLPHDMNEEKHEEEINFFIENAGYWVSKGYERACNIYKHWYEGAFQRSENFLNKFVKDITKYSLDLNSKLVIEVNLQDVHIEAKLYTPQYYGYELARRDSLYC